MKIKGSVKKFSKKLLFAFFGIEGLLFVILRFYQMLKLTDPETGFFTNRSDFTVPVFYVLWFITVLGALIMFYLSPDCETGAFAIRKNPAQALGSFAMAVGIFADVFNRINNLRNGVTGYAANSYITGTKPYLTYGCIIFGVLAGIVFIIDTAGFAAGKKFVNSLKICHLFPVLWLFFITVGYFSITVSYLNVSQLMLMIFADAFLMVFLFEYGRFVSDTGANEAPWLLFATGTISLILICASLLPDIFFVVSGQSDRLVANCPLNAYDAAAIAFIIATLFNAGVNKNYIPVPIEPAHQDEETEQSGEDISENA